MLMLEFMSQTERRGGKPLALILLPLLWGLECFLLFVLFFFLILWFIVFISPLRFLLHFFSRSSHGISSAIAMDSPTAGFKSSKGQRCFSSRFGDHSADKRGSVGWAAESARNKGALFDRFSFADSLAKSPVHCGSF